MKTAPRANLTILLVLAALTAGACTSADAPARTAPAGRTSPTLWVAVDLPGSSAQEISRLCVEPIEREVSAIPEVVRIVSNIAEARAEMAIWARPSTQQRIFRQKLLIALDEVAPRLPAGVEGPHLLRYDPLKTLLTAPRAADFQTPEHLVTLRDDKLSELGLDRSEVLNQITIQVQSKPEDAAEIPDLKALMINTPDGRTLPLGELADITPAADRPGMIIRVWPPREQ